MTRARDLSFLANTITAGTNVVISNGLSVSGVVTATSFNGDGSKLSGVIATYSTSSGIATYSDTSGIATYSGISGVSTYASTAGIATYSGASGISTLAQGLTGTPNLNIGVVTATSFFGDGSNLSGVQGSNLNYYSSHSETSGTSANISGISSFSQVGILTGSLANVSGDSFGRSVAITPDGKTIVVGATFDELTGTTGCGVVYVFDRVGNSFNQVGIITGSFAGQTNDNFGWSVTTSYDGKTIIVGSPNDELSGTTGNGVAYVFDRVGVGTSSTFTEVGVLTGSLASDSSDNFGGSVCCSSDAKTIFVGASNDEISGLSNHGIVYAFDRSGSNFTQVGIITGSTALSSFDGFGGGVSCSADGKTLIVGANSAGGGFQGRAYVFDRIGINNFSQVGILTGSLVENSDAFGSSVKITPDGKKIFVGATNDEVGATSNQGIVYAFERVGNTFSQVGIITANSDSDSQFGLDIDANFDGSIVVVGAHWQDISGVQDCGAVYVFEKEGNVFNQIGFLTGSYSNNSTDYFGYSVAISADGKTLISGAYNDEVPGGSNTGVVYVYDQVRSSYLFSTPSGNIGIGTAAATSKLTVQGDVRIIGVTTITGNLNAAGNSYVKLARTTNQTIISNADALIGFTATSDANGWYSGITTRTTPTVAGTYRVDAMVNWAAGTVVNNQTNIQIRKNGSTFALHQVGIQTNFAYTQTACGIVTMNGTSDYIDFTVFTGNTTNQVVTGTGDGAWTKMEIFKIN